MRRSLIIAVAILATMTVALVALAVEPFVDGDTITDRPKIGRANVWTPGTDVVSKPVAA